MQTYLFTDKQKSKALFWLVLFHILVITSSNYLVQFPFSITLPNGFEVHSTWGALTFPFIFLVTDLTVRIFGKPLARRIIFFVMFPALIISYALSVLFAEGQWTGWQSLTTFSMFVFRIALASFSAYLFGQIMDIFVFNKLRSLKSWWIAPTASMFMGNAMDTIIFFFVAFYASSDSFMAANWTHIAFVDYLFKLVICMGLFLPAYGVLLNMIMKKLSQFVQTQQLTAVEQN
ncbi:7-cyano-7-deazaguanine/7-aminomethyl-7-deazaguanine transporter [Kingella negevensis]|uniref:7-cyano-7-deazaguanine/7-aminomethyl-7- deazaguanine transporter n=1 Tax=Kingella negevensis TaxID=1522312 RepID=UPI0025439903|nr:7-cyano-7-deazaguanine/7-aminomethyl-7-deazaguanine transporter [Kingella negevensis]WII94006.1 7-cyano-7-deazaguanine/7-aminomethyl-7-deazaguanine transporter [Kingella negevensis]